jgi:hypothetical protein
MGGRAHLRPVGAELGANRRWVPAHTIDIAGDAAVFSVARNGVSVPLLRATRRGARLEWAETDAFADEGEATYAATPTFALALAVEEIG